MYFRHTRAFALIHPFQEVPEGCAPNILKSKQEKGRDKIQEREDAKQERSEGLSDFSMKENFTGKSCVTGKENHQRIQRSRRRRTQGGKRNLPDHPMGLNTLKLCGELVMDTWRAKKKDILIHKYGKMID